jgi:hypothetical protein
MGCCVSFFFDLFTGHPVASFCAALLLLVYLKSKHQEADLILECAARIQKSQSRRMDNAATPSSVAVAAPEKNGVHKYQFTLNTHMSQTPRHRQLA